MTSELQKKTLAKIGRAIVTEVDRGPKAEHTRVSQDLAAFVEGIGLLDGRVLPSARRNSARRTWAEEELTRIKLAVSVEVRNTLEGGANLSARAAAKLPATEDLLEILESRVFALAREDVNTFCEMVAVDDETGQPLRQAPIHREWARLCDEQSRLLIWSHIESGKTSQLSILRTVWELGNDPTLRFVILSNTGGQATKIVKAIASLIKNSEAVKRIFPGLVPDADGPWTNTELKVVRSNAAKDPSVRAVGVHGQLVGGRVDRLVIDDLLDQENTETEAARKKVESWVKASALTRLTKRSRILVVGTAWHPRDLLHVFAKQKVWKAVRFPVLDALEQSTWPEAWSLDRIAAAREALGPAEFARNLLCLARDDGEARFKEQWIDAAIEKGEGVPLVRNIEEIFEDGHLPPGWETFTGVDLGVKRTKKSDESAFFTFLEDPKGNRRVLNIEAGKFTGPALVDMIIDHHTRYRSTVVVENVAAQDFILQFARDISNVPVVPFTTSKAKRDPVLGVEGLAIELSNGKWIIPSAGKKCAPQIEAWIQEMLFFSPSAHTGDRLMASYFARERARKRSTGTASVGLRLIGADTSPARTERPWTERVVAVADTDSDAEWNARARLRDAS